MNATAGRRRFFRSLAQMGGGSVAGYAFILLLAPALTRLYGPEAFGLFSIFGAVYAILSIVAPLGLDHGIVNSRRLPDALRMSSAALESAGVIALVALLVAAPAARALPADFGIEPNVVVLAVILSPVAVLGAVATNWAIRRHQIARAGFATFINLAGRSLFQLGFGLWFGGLYGLIAGEFLGRIVSYAVVETGMINKALRRITGKPFDVIRHIRENSGFPLFVMPAMTMDVLMVWIPAPLFTLAYGPAAGGLLVFIQRLGSAPLTIANQSLGQLFHLRATQAMHKSPKRVLGWFGYIAAVSFSGAMVVWMILFFYGTEIFSFVFGQNWAQATQVALIWAPLIYVQFLSLLTSRIALVINIMEVRLVSSAANIMVMTSSFAVAQIYGGSFHFAMVIVVASLTTSHVISIVVVLWRAFKVGPR